MTTEAIIATDRHCAGSKEARIRRLAETTLIRQAT
jgi:hypothetical protein